MNPIIMNPNPIVPKIGLWEKVLGCVPEVMDLLSKVKPFILSGTTEAEKKLQIQSALDQHAKLIAAMTEQSAGMIEKIKELEDVNQKLLAERKTMENKLNAALGLSVISVVIVAVKIL